MPTLLLVTRALLDQSRPGSRRTRRLVEACMERGWRVAALTECAPGVVGLYSQWNSQPDEWGCGTDSSAKAAEGARRRVLPGVWILRNARGFLTRTPDDWFWKLLTAAWRNRREIAALRPDVVLSSGPPHSAHLIAATLANHMNVPLVLDFRDPWARAPWGARPLNPWGERFLWAFEKYVVRRAAAVVCVTRRHCELMARIYRDVPKHRFWWLPNGFDPCTNGLAAEAERLRRELVQNGELLVVHAGSLYGKRDPRPFLAALADLPAAVRRRLLVVHAGPVSPLYRQAVEAASERLDCFRYLGTLAPETAEALVAAADFLWVLQPGTALQVPSKLYDAFAHRKPVLLLADEGEAADLVRRYGLGLVSGPRAVSEIRGALAELVERGKAWPDSDGLRRGARQFCGRAVARQYVKALEQLAAGTSKPSQTQWTLEVA